MKASVFNKRRAVFGVAQSDSDGSFLLQQRTKGETLKSWMVLSLMLASLYCEQFNRRNLNHHQNRFCGYILPVKVMYLMSLYRNVFKKAEE